MAKIVETKIDMPSFDDVVKDLGMNKTGDFQQHMTHRARVRMERHVPSSVGVPARPSGLRETAQEDYDGVIYGPSGTEANAYASIVYHWPQEGIHWTTPGTGSFWDKRMMADQEEQLIQDIQTFIDRRKD